MAAEEDEDAEDTETDREFGARQHGEGKRSTKDHIRMDHRLGLSGTKEYEKVHDWMHERGEHAGHTHAMAGIFNDRRP